MIHVILIAPWLLIGTTYLVYQFLARRYGVKGGYLGGFIFYWIVWGVLVPLAMLGPLTLHDLLAPGSPFGNPWWLGTFCLLGPPLVSLWTIFPNAVRKASTRLILLSAILAIVNGTLEEVFWRGVFTATFPQNFWLGVLYPSVGFALWHFVPQSLFPSKGPGGRTALAIGAGFLGLLWGWVVYSTGSIFWVAVSHILVDFSALGWRMYFESSPEVK